MPTIVITGVSVSPPGGLQDFSAPSFYTVTAADGSTKTYTVTVSVALNSAKDITQFTILGVNGSIAGTNISLTVPFGSDPTNLTPTITITGVSVSPASGVAQDFSGGPVSYTVTAQDGSTQTYAVTVSVALNSAKDITQFTILGVDGAIAGTNISLTLPFGSTSTNLTPTITITGVSVSPASGVAQDFSGGPVSYTVTAQDGSTQTYAVTVGVALNSAKDITQFTILGVDGAIAGTNISLTLPYGKDPTSLTPTITITGVSVSPVSGLAQDFSGGPVSYTVTAQDGSTQTYTVTVSVALNSAKDITQFTILGVNGAIAGTNISLRLPYGTDVTSLTPTITITGVSVSPASGVAQDFTAPVAYTVTAQDASTQTYMVTVNIALNSSKDITQFTILGVDGVIVGTTISLTLPFGTDVTSLTPTIAITGASVSPASGAAQDFSAPVPYTVVASDASTKTYTVTVSVALNSAKDITQFTILGVNGTIVGTTISLTLPFSTDVTNLTPTIAITGASVSPASGVVEDFSAARAYTVTAADGSTKTYTVTVTVAQNSAKDITQFTILGLNATISGTAISPDAAGQYGPDQPDAHDRDHRRECQPGDWRRTELHGPRRLHRHRGRWLDEGLHGNGNRRAEQRQGHHRVLDPWRGRHLQRHEHHSDAAVRHQPDELGPDDRDHRRQRESGDRRGAGLHRPGHLYGHSGGWVDPDVHGDGQSRVGQCQGHHPVHGRWPRCGDRDDQPDHRHDRVGPAEGDQPHRAGAHDHDHRRECQPGKRGRAQLQRPGHLCGHGGGRFDQDVYGDDRHGQRYGHQADLGLHHPRSSWLDHERFVERDDHAGAATRDRSEPADADDHHELLERESAERGARRLHSPGHLHGDCRGRIDQSLYSNRHRRAVI